MQYLLYLFPLLFLGSFALALYKVVKGNANGLFIFLIGGLPFYAISLSLIYLLGGKIWVPIIQSFKEIIILATLVTLLFQKNTIVRLHLLDKLIIAFFIFSLLFVPLPLGSFSFLQKLVAFKSLSFFPLIYFCGRLFPLQKTHLQKQFSFILILTIAAALLSAGEYLVQTHLQTYTGYATFNDYVYKQDPSGSYGLSWTFEIENGVKRFAAFFSTPLEHASATLIALAIIAGLYTEKNRKINLQPLGWFALLATVACILFSLSRAALLGYFLMILIYSFLTRRKEILSVFYLLVISFIFYLFSFSSKEMQEFVANSIQFSNNSSIGHVLEWVAGIEAMITSPLGMGLGASGRVTALEGDAVGGENQFIIVGVQIGITGLLLYLTIYFYSMFQAYKTYRFLEGKEKQITMIVLLLRVGLFLPMFTSNLDSYIYVSYVLWFLNGLFGTVLENKFQKEKQLSIANSQLK